MKRQFSAFVSIFLALAVIASPAIANQQTFGGCLVDALTGKERKQLAQWIYFGIAAHPEMASYSRVNSEDRSTSDKVVALLVMRLLTEDCAAEFAAAQQSDPLAVQKAFELVGRVAMMELMNDQAVASALSTYAEHLDQSRINAVAEGGHGEP